ncbi:MAG: MBL fold metallo-hydrolase [Verrucomicrobia bacterium]|nr:MBL fold metallo-hydrolase [Verrucomicrobiota bacterium]
MKDKRIHPLAVPFLALALAVSVQPASAQLTSNPDPSKPSFSEVKYVAGGEILLRLNVPTNNNSRLEVSTDLVTWTPLYTFPATPTAQSYTDSTAPFLPVRYYRAVQLAAPSPVTGDHLVTADGDVVVYPINHATFAANWKDKIIYFDPVGGATRFRTLPRPNIVFITDIHGDHLEASTLSAIDAKNADIVAPQAVYQQLASDLKAKTKVMANGDKAEIQGIAVEAIPMYNITAGRTGHTKGRGNGYVLTIGGKRFYIAGDTEDIPEMRALKDIDMAFVCMNLPFTMDINQAASAVREFRPKVVYPYHYSSSDVNRFKQLVGKDVGVEVRLRKWY